MSRAEFTSGLLNRYDYIIELIDNLEDQLEPHDTGHIHTAINVLLTEKEKLRKQIEDCLA